MEPGVVGDTLIAWQGWGMMASATILLIILIRILTWLLPFPERSLANQLENPASRERLRTRLGGAHPLERYRTAIRELNSWLDAWFGPSTSGQALERCIAIAFIYPVALFLLTVLINGALSGKVQLHEIAIFAVAVVIGAYAIRYLFHGVYRLSTGVWGFIGGDSDLIQLVARVMLGALAVIIAFAIALVIATSVAGAFAEPGTMVLAIMAAFVLAFALAALLAVAGTFVTALFLVALTIVMLAFAGQFAFLLILFFVLLPMVNAVFDWGSWAVTRFFLRRVAQVPDGVRGAFLLVAELTADLAAAGLFLFALAMLLANGIEVLNAILATVHREPFAWRALLDAAIAEPLSQGLFVIGMLITTLVPTFIHLTDGLAGVLTAWTPGAEPAAAALKDNPEPEAELRPSARQMAMRALLIARLWYIPAAVVAFMVFAGSALLLSALGMPVGSLLRTVALCSSAWSHGVCF